MARNKVAAASPRYVDRKGAPIAIGSMVELSHCVGRYGSMAVESGEVVSFDDVYRGVVLRLAKRSRVVDGRSGGVSYIEPGGERYFSLPIGNPSERPMRCEKVHNDFEHGHVAYVEVKS